jgi:hypothetical protein
VFSDLTKLGPGVQHEINFITNRKFLTRCIVGPFEMKKKITADHKVYSAARCVIRGTSVMISGVGTLFLTQINDCRNVVYLIVNKDIVSYQE